jgi:hypothetical protein
LKDLTIFHYDEARKISLPTKLNALKLHTSFTFRTPFLEVVNWKEVFHDLEEVELSGLHVSSQEMMDYILHMSPDLKVRICTPLVSNVSGFHVSFIKTTSNVSPSIESP